MKRPLGVTIVCWIIIVFAIIGVISSLYSFLHFDTLVKAVQQQAEIPPQSLKLHLQAGIIVSAVNIVLGFCMLKGKIWARFTYLILGVVMQIWAFMTSHIGIALIIGLVIFLIFVYLLFNKKAGEFFKAET